MTDRSWLANGEPHHFPSFAGLGDDSPFIGQFFDDHQTATPEVDRRWLAKHRKSETGVSYFDPHHAVGYHNADLEFGRGVLHTIRRQFGHHQLDGIEERFWHLSQGLDHEASGTRYRCQDASKYAAIPLSPGRSGVDGRHPSWFGR